MYTDKQLLFSEDQAITASAASTNYLDLLAAGDAYDEPWMVFQVTETFDSLTSLAFAIQTDDNTSFSSATTLHTETKLLAALASGLEFAVRVPVGKEQYLRCYYTVTGTNPSVGKVNAFITPEFAHGVK